MASTTKTLLDALHIAWSVKKNRNPHDAERYADAIEEMTGRRPGQTKTYCAGCEEKRNRIRLGKSLGTGNDDLLIVATQKAGHSLRSLAEKVGVSVALLSMARDGQRPLRFEVAKAVEDITGFAATRKNWPLLDGHIR